MNNQRPGNSKAIASLVLGILSLVVAWFSSATLAMILAIVGIICSIQSRKENTGGQNGMATGGLACSIIAIVICSFKFISCVLCAGVIGSSLSFLL